MIEGPPSARAGAKASTGAGFLGTSVIIGGMRSAEKRVLNAVSTLRGRAAAETSVAGRASCESWTSPRLYGRSGGTGTGPRDATRLPNCGRNGFDEASRIGEGIRNSAWLFPVIEAVHLLALAAIGGAVLMVNLRLLGAGLRRQPVAAIADAMQPLLVGSLGVMLGTGILLFLAESVKCYYSAAFWWKMTSLALALLFTFTVQARVTHADEARVGPIWRTVVALVGLALWFGVGAGGRWIGFS